MARFREVQVLPSLSRGRERRSNSGVWRSRALTVGPGQPSGGGRQTSHEEVGGAVGSLLVVAKQAGARFHRDRARAGSR